MKLAVYGSLKKNRYNHSMINHCKFIESGVTKGTMYSRGAYPMLMPKGEDIHKIEIYDIDLTTYVNIYEMEIGAGYYEAKLDDGTYIFYGDIGTELNKKDIISKY